MRLGSGGALLLPQACHVGFLLWVWGSGGLGWDRLGRIWRLFLGSPVPPGEEEPLLLSWVSPSLPVAGGILCELGLEAGVFDSPPSKGGVLGPSVEPMRSCRRAARAPDWWADGQWAGPRCRPATGHVLPCSARRVGGVGLLEPVLPQLRAGVPEPDADLRAPPARRQGLRGSRAAD